MIIVAAVGVVGVVAGSIVGGGGSGSGSGWVWVR